MENAFHSNATFAMNKKIASLNLHQKTLNSQSVTEDKFTQYDFTQYFPVIAYDLSQIPYFAEPMVAFFEKNRFELYSKASNHPLYNTDLFTGLKLSHEITMKRVFSVMLAAEERDDARQLLISLLKSYPYTKPVVQKIEDGKLTDEEINELAHQLMTKYIRQNSIIYYFSYFHINTWNDSSVSRAIFIIFCRVDEHRALINMSEYKNKIDTIDVHERVKIIRECRQAFDYISSGEELMQLGDLYSLLCTLGGYTELINTPDKELPVIDQSYLNLIRSKNEKLSDDMLRALSFVSIMDAVLKYHRLVPTAFFQNELLTKEDKKAIPKILAHVNSAGLLSNENSIYFSEYAIASCFYIIARIFKESRDFHMANNSETEFFELEKYINENEQLKKTIEIIESERDASILENRKLNGIITDLKEANNEADRDLVKPYQDEIEMLRAKVASLESALDEKEKEAQELYRLRELAFDLKQSDYIPEGKKPLSKLIAGKKLVLVGGHINLRNKLTEKYPDMTILDGHNASVPESVFANADLIIFNTANMSHTVYYRVLNIIRANGIKFDYLGRVSNPDLIEQELARIVEKHI